MNDSEYIIVGMDRVLDMAINRNISFIDILYDGEQLLDLAVKEYISRQVGSGSPLVNNAYATAYNAGAAEDRTTFNEIINQLVSAIVQDVSAAYRYANTERPIVDYAYKDHLVFLRLG